MRHNADYKCKFCGKPGSVSYEIESGTETMFSIEKWLSMLACNRCADFRSNVRMTTDRIGRICAIYHAATLAHGDTARAATREKLTAPVQNLTRIVCDYYRMRRLDDPEFVEILMDRPLHAATVIKTYIQGISKMSREAV